MSCLSAGFSVRLTVMIIRACSDVLAFVCLLRRLRIVNCTSQLAAWNALPASPQSRLFRRWLSGREETCEIGPLKCLDQLMN
ncbi:uncharacterized protein LY79DRAFT_549271 [Colletotrichum navitas]|uniref:Secreted protein n=1 Tax=Colletotrichum navitas TaxID=681940 RepID=A0AAD8Q2F5_9PEZI|nr:uncharacterized protein LY79DRAFT_549271 [Colletotrichum navitas]KAK1594631.1 hypothetical protein LY79DRAFT_549271 [Colletotrichum navitas]